MMDTHQTSAPENQRIYSLFKVISFFNGIFCQGLENPDSSCWGMMYNFLEAQTRYYLDLSINAWHL